MRTMKFNASEDLLIPPRYNADTIRKTVSAQVSTIQSDVEKAVKAFLDMADIDLAEGVWLDRLAARVGIRRPYIHNSQTLRFGFHGPTRSRGFEQASFNSTEPSGEYVGLSDDIFRKLIKARGLLDIGRGTFQDFKKAVNIISEEAESVDNRDMSITIYTSNTEIFGLAEKADALPRTAGVEVNYVERDVFGFQGAGDGFDQSRFRQ